MSALHSPEEAADWADECREWIDALAAVRRVQRDVRRWVQVLRGRSIVRVIATWTR